MRTNIVSYFICLFLTGCISISSYNHSPQQAIIVAEQFAKTSFIEQDFVKAYGLLSSSSKQYASFEHFREGISKMHPSSYPVSIIATGYEPLMFQKGMNIFIYGKNGEEKFYYRILVEGTAETGYQVAGFGRKKDSYAGNIFKINTNSQELQK